MTTARTRASLFHCRSTSAISARIGVSHALSFHGLLSVTVAMPSVTSVRTGRSLVFDMRRYVSCSILHEPFRRQAAMEPVHQGYHVEHGQAGEPGDVLRVRREVRALEH